MRESEYDATHHGLCSNRAMTESDINIHKYSLSIVRKLFRNICASTDIPVIYPKLRMRCDTHIILLLVRLSIGPEVYSPSYNARSKWLCRRDMYRDGGYINS